MYVRRLKIALVVYTIILSLFVCYTIITHTSSTSSVPQRDTLQFRPAKPVSFQNSSTIDTKYFKRESAEIRPPVLNFYRSMKDNQPLDIHCSTCAVVSSSGQLLGKRAGEEIDNSACVLRMNTAAVKGFEKDVGTRTTVRVVSFSAAYAVKDYASSVLLGPYKTEMILFWGLHQPKHITQQQLTNEVSSKYEDNVGFYSQTKEGEEAAGSVFMDEIGYSRDKTQSWLSTGWFTIMAALDMCGEIHIYGMIPDDYCESHKKGATKFHYFQEKATPTECEVYAKHEAQSKGSHRFMTEKAVFARWGKKYKLKFHHPMWNLDAVNISKPMDTPFIRRQSKH